MIIKVCGMREERNIREVSALDVDWLGFIFYSKSPRRVLPPIEPRTLLKERQKSVGVFVNASPERIMETAIACRLDYLQLHGDESPDDCHALRKRGFALIKALPVAAPEDLEKAKAYEGRVDYLLFDTRCEGYGGSGKAFYWSLLSHYDGETPFLHSGGIRPESAESLRRFRHPRLAGIDLNSGFEREPGLKDAEKLRDFVRRVRAAWNGG